MSQCAPTTEPEVACTLPEERQAERRKEIRAGIMQRIRRVRELPDGYAFGFDLVASDEAEVRDFVAFERECCGFARYDVERDEADSALWLSVRGPGGTKECVKQLVPDSVQVERAAGEHGREKRLLRAGFAGIGAALVAIVCCATPMLAIALGAVGLGAAVASASLWLDAIVAPLLLASLAAIGVATWRRRAARQTG
jgi:hypothetical protein